MSMGSSDMMKFTSEDWQEAFIQIGGDGEAGAEESGGMQQQPAQRRGMDTSTFGMSSVLCGDVM